MHACSFIYIVLDKSCEVSTRYVSVIPYELNFNNIIMLRNQHIKAAAETRTSAHARSLVLY